MAPIVREAFEFPMPGALSARLAHAGVLRKRVPVQEQSPPPSCRLLRAPLPRTITLVPEPRNAPEADCARNMHARRGIGIRGGRSPELPTAARGIPGTWLQCSVCFPL